MKISAQDIRTPQEGWPVALTPELREKLLLAKISRIQQTYELRKKCPGMQMLAEIDRLSAHDKNCPHV